MVIIENIKSNNQNHLFQRSQFLMLHNRLSSILKGTASLAVIALPLIPFFINGCYDGAAGGNPTLPLSTTNGTTRVFKTSTPSLNIAITNAFGDLNYHNMLLLAVNDAKEGVWDYLAPNWHPTNGFLLYPSSPMGGIPLDSGVTVPYRAIFFIEVLPSTNVDEILVTVRTMRAEVVDGTEIGVHGGKASHFRRVPAVRQEEEKVLQVIAAKVATSN